MRFVVSSLIALGLIGAAHANTIEQVEVEISYNKADLQTSEGAELVLATIEREARKDCRIAGSYSTLLNGMMDEKCYKEIVSKAVAKIDAPTLTRVYSQKLG